jgi:hypothetical protein
MAIQRLFVAFLVVSGFVGIAQADDYEFELPADVAIAPGASVDVPVTIRNNTASATSALWLSVFVDLGFHYESLSQPDCGAFEPRAGFESTIRANITPIAAGTQRTCVVRISRDSGADSITANFEVQAQELPAVFEYGFVRIGSFGEVALSVSPVSSEVVSDDPLSHTVRVLRTVRLSGLNQGASSVQAIVRMDQCISEQAAQPDACIITPGCDTGFPGPPGPRAILPSASSGSTSSCTVAFTTSTTENALFDAQVVGLTEQDGTFAFDTDDTNSNIALALPAPTVPTNQYGLSGSWVNPAAASQGIVLSIQPDFYGAGNALLFGGWFTYAPYADQGQRWYTIQAETAGGMQQMPIYRTDGGLFASPMPTTTTQVGTATLRFFDCRYGSLDYSILDNGSLLQGTMPLNRLLNNVRCGNGGDTGNSTSSYQLTGVWADPTNSGQGLVLEVDTTQHVLFGAWYTFASNAAQAGLRRWYTLQATIDDNAIQTGQIAIFASTGGRFGGGGTPTTEYVGSGMLIEHDCNSATLTYEFTSGENAGLAGTLQLGRLGSAPPECD